MRNPECGPETLTSCTEREPGAEVCARALVDTYAGEPVTTVAETLRDSVYVDNLDTSGNADITCKRPNCSASCVVILLHGEPLVVASSFDPGCAEENEITTQLGVNGNLYGTA